jgi:tetratricopeptide (TPR) repeat protein
VLLKALAKDRADRYTNVDSLVKAFKESWIEAGVPMQGTAITLRPAAFKGGQKPTPVKTGVPVAATVAGKGAEAQGRSPWPFIAGGLLLLLCLVFAAFAFLGRNRLRSILGTASATNPPLSTAALQSTTTPIVMTDTPQAASVETSIPAIATALSAVNQNPNNPQVNLELSFAYFDAGQIPESLQALAKASDLAGPKNTQFFINAGDQFKQRQAWIAATAMYLRAIKSLGPGVISNPDLVVNYHEALYKAAVSPDMPAYLPFADLGRVEQPITLVAQARHLYYNGQTDQAHQILNQVKVLKPHMAEASLLEAEMDAAEGKTFDAKQILNILFADLNTPDWVREMAQTLSNKIP